MQGRFMMTPLEMGRSYRQSKDKDEQIIILSELNDCSVTSIINILVAGGYDVNITEEHRAHDTIMSMLKDGHVDKEIAEALGWDTPRVVSWRGMRGVEHNPARPSKHDQYMAGYRRGLTDPQIAEEVGVARGTIFRWRKRNNLPAVSRAKTLAKRKKANA